MPVPDNNTIRLRQLLSSRLSNWSLALALGVMTLLAAVTLLALSGWFISAAALAGLTTAGAFGFDYFRPAAIIRLCAIGRTAGRYGERLCSHYAALGLLKDLRVSRFAALTGANQVTLHSSDTLQRIVGDIDLLDQFPLRVMAPWIWGSLLTLLVLAFWYWLAPVLFLTAALPVVLAWLLVPALTAWRGIALARQETQFAQQRRWQLLAPLSMLTSLLLWQRWDQSQQQFAITDQRYMQLHLKQQRLASIAVLTQQILLVSAMLLLLNQGLELLNSQQLSLPLLLAALLSLWALYEILAPLCSSFSALGLSLAARDRLNQLTSNNLTCSPNNGHSQPAGPWKLSACSISARHPGALSGPQNIDLSICSGEVLLIQGPSGVGKSTLLQVLANQLPYQGSLELNGLGYDQWQLENTLGYLPQQLDIFDLTLAQNLRLGAASANDDALWQVLADVALADWVKQQPAQLNTTLGEYGTTISGGQARRIALARLLLTKRPVLLLDEPFAGLDQHSIDHVTQALLKRQQHGILIIVSHQCLNISNAATLTLSM